MVDVLTLAGMVEFGVAWAAPEAAGWMRLQTEPLPPAPGLPPQLLVNPCFAAGTRILTEHGEVAVEALRPGDVVILAEGEAREVIWVGRRDIDLLRHPMPGAVRPVRIAAGALGLGVPERELVVSPDHGLYFDGSLVQAKDIVDGVAVVQDFVAPSVRYYHVELPEHGILLAEGAGAESYLDTGHRGVFSNAAKPVILHPDLMQIRREAGSAAPLLIGGPALAAIRARLHARKLMLGFAVTEAPALALKIGDKMIAPAEMTLSRAVFKIPAGATAAVLCSPVFIPAEVDPSSDDRRVLGIALTDVALDGRFLPIESVVRAADLHRRGPREAASWTRGAALLKFPIGTGELAFHIAALPRLWRRAA